VEELKWELLEPVARAVAVLEENQTRPLKAHKAALTPVAAAAVVLGQHRMPAPMAVLAWSSLSFPIHTQFPTLVVV
jgi:hypothetical protein